MLAIDPAKFKIGERQLKFTGRGSRMTYNRIYDYHNRIYSTMEIFDYIRF